MKKYILVLLVLICISSATDAQKFGYLNTTQLLLSMPEIKAADTELQSYQGQLVGQGEQMVKDYESDYSNYLVKVDAGQLSQIQMQNAEGELVKAQQNIQKYQVEVQDLIQQKKQQLYGPVLKKVQELVTQIGKDMGYTMIFDASIGGMLFATESDDLMPLVKSKLGI